jgi:K+-sensing histidine kinase KdpD
VLLSSQGWIAAGIALTTTMLAAILALLLASYEIDGVQLVFVLAVVVALFWGGASAGIAAAVFSCPVFWFFFVPPVWTIAWPTLTGALTTALVLAVSLLIIIIWERQRQTIYEVTDAIIDIRAKLNKQVRG